VGVDIDSRRQLDERVPARPECIARARHAVVDFAALSGASDSDLEDIAVAVSEAVTNVVQHAYLGRDAEGDLVLQAWVQERRLQVVIRDEGIGMRGGGSPRPGHGLAIIHRITENLQIEDAMPGVRVRMTFDVGWG
jgi:anti-sigma regulatory factor (Ser/Thr protein kinase)